MHKFTLALCIACITLLNPNRSYSQIIYQDVPPLTQVSELQNMMLQADSIRKEYEKTGFTHGRMDMLEINQQAYLLPDGHFDVFAWSGEKWKKLYKGIYFGYNHGAKKLIQNGIIYSFGGTGFWHSHGDVIWFNIEKGEWELVISSPELSEGHAYIHEEKLYVFGKDCYEVNIGTKKITMLHNCPSLPPLDKHNNSATLEMKGYALQLDNSLAYDKKTRAHLSFDNQLFMPQGQNLLHNQHLIRIHGDSLVVWNNSMKKLASFDVSQLAEKHFVPFSEGVGAGYVLVLVFLAIALVIVIFVWYWRGGPKETESAFLSVPDEREANPLIKELLKHTNELISADKLDKILGIQNIASPDTLRYKRAQLIKELNEYYEKSRRYKLIHRIPDPNDGRKYVYEIKE